MARETIVTAEGYEKLKTEIDDLSGRGRKEIADRIKEARDFGDIAENAEYDAAKNDQAMLEGRIALLEDKLRSAVIVDEKNLENDVVSVGTTVHLKDQKTDKSVKYKIVGSSEADPAAGKLSNESPIGKALMGHKRNDIVKVPVPRGPQRQLKITKIDA
jgi:transcription elongation factor GreA